MLPSTHLLISIILSIVFFPVFSGFSFLILIGGVLIDIDHYLLYILNKKDLNLKRAYLFFRKKQRKKFKNEIYVFHTIEFITLMLIVSKYSINILLITIGLISHLILDWINEIKQQKRKRLFLLDYRKIFKNIQLLKTMRK